MPSASAYFRFYWPEIEPADNEIEFAWFDERLAHARRAGQKLAFRVMCTASGEYQDVSGWLKERGCRGVEFRYGGKLHRVPDFGDPLFQKTHFRLIEALGRRYDGHPDLDLVDIRNICDYALRCHASCMNNTSAPIPEGTSPDIERFLRKMGYRLVIREVAQPAVADRRSPVTALLQLVTNRPLAS